MMKVRGKVPFVCLVLILFPQVVSAARRLGASGKACLGDNCVRVRVGSSGCLGGDTLLFSCTEDRYVRARDVRTGDSVRTIDRADGLPACSEVYYTFKHRGLSSALSIKVGDATSKDDNVHDKDDNTFVVSHHHLVYVGSSFETRRPVLAKDLSPGDRLVSTGVGGGAVYRDGGGGATTNNTLVVVSSIEPVSNVDLVNVLTVEPALELSNGVVISAHSYHEVLYSYVFWPFRLMYSLIGRRVDHMLPALDKVDSFVVQPVALMFSDL